MKKAQWCSAVRSSPRSPRCMSCTHTSTVCPQTADAGRGKKKRQQGFQWTDNVHIFQLIQVKNCVLLCFSCSMGKLHFFKVRVVVLSFRLNIIYLIYFSLCSSYKVPCRGKFVRMVQVFLCPPCPLYPLPPDFILESLNIEFAIASAKGFEGPKSGTKKTVYWHLKPHKCCVSMTTLSVTKVVILHPLNEQM